MDPIATILGALSAAGALIGDQAIKDGYAGLKTLIVERFGSDNPRLAERIDDYVQDPETFVKPAEKALRDANVGQDTEVVSRAEELRKQVESARPGTSGGLIGHLEAKDSNVGVVGGDLHGGMSFGTRPGRES